MMKLKPVDSISEIYLHHVLMSPYGRSYFRNNASGAQKSMPKINQGIVSNTLVPLCGYAEQQVIVAKVEKLLSFCNELEDQISLNQDNSEKLMPTVLTEVFSHQPILSEVANA